MAVEIIPKEDVNPICSVRNRHNINGHNTNIQLIDDKDVMIEENRDDITVDNSDYKEIDHVKRGIEYLLSKDYPRNDIIINGAGRGKADLTTKSDNQDWEIKMLSAGNAIIFTYDQILHMEPMTRVLLFTKADEEFVDVLYFKDIILGMYPYYNIKISAILTLEDTKIIVSFLTGKDITKRMCDKLSKFKIYRNIKFKELNATGREHTYVHRQCSNDLEKNFITNKEDAYWFPIVYDEWVLIDVYNKFLYDQKFENEIVNNSPVFRHKIINIIFGYRRDRLKEFYGHVTEDNIEKFVDYLLENRKSQITSKNKNDKLEKLMDINSYLEYQARDDKQTS